MYVHLETRKVHGISEHRVDWGGSDTQPMGKAERQTHLNGKALPFYIERQSPSSCPSSREALKNARILGLREL